MERGREKRSYGGAIKIGDKRLGLVLTYMREDRQRNWEEIERLREKERGAVLVVGDFNARTGKEGGEWGEDGSLRESKDEVINGEGEEMLARLGDMGLEILNGCVEGDETGEYTFVGPVGSTVIDYAIGNEEGCRLVEKMEVRHRTDSDHAALEINLEGKVSEGAVKEEKWRIRWDEEAIAEYKEKLGDMRDIETWEELRDRIKGALVKKKVKIGRR